jgi:hypothetical protein
LTVAKNSGTITPYNLSISLEKTGYVTYSLPKASHRAKCRFQLVIEKQRGGDAAKGKGLIAVNPFTLSHVKVYPPSLWRARHRSQCCFHVFSYSTQETTSPKFTDAKRQIEVHFHWGAFQKSLRYILLLFQNFRDLPRQFLHVKGFLNEAVTATVQYLCCLTAYAIST